MFGLCAVVSQMAFLSTKQHCGLLRLSHAQLYDVEIDKTNKPYLPLAAGDFSMTTGVVIVVLTGAASLFIAWASGSMALLATVSGSLLLGLVYSCDLPLLRWKRSPVLAAACILAVRALLVQIGFFLHMKRALVPGAGLVLARPIVFATAFMLLFSVVIAMFKARKAAAAAAAAGELASMLLAKLAFIEAREETRRLALHASSACDGLLPVQNESLQCVTGHS